MRLCKNTIEIIIVDVHQGWYNKNQVFGFTSQTPHRRKSSASLQSPGVPISPTSLSPLSSPYSLPYTSPYSSPQSSSYSKCTEKYNPYSQTTSSNRPPQHFSRLQKSAISSSLFDINNARAAVEDLPKITLNVTPTRSNPGHLTKRPSNQLLLKPPAGPPARWRSEEQLVRPYRQIVTIQAACKTIQADCFQQLVTPKIELV